MHRLEKTVSVLISAFMKGTLIHGFGCDKGCAIYAMVNFKGWEHFGETGYEYSPDGEKIEQAFEGRSEPTIYSPRTLTAGNDSDSFKGLTNVFDVLCNDIDASYFREQEAKIDLKKILQTQ